MKPIVLEGPDGGGKTTLAEALLATLEYRIGIKNVAPQPMTTREDLFEAYLSQLNIPGVIIDRSWPSEAVYGARFRGGSLLLPHDLAALGGALRRAGGLIVLCLPPVDACVQAWRDRKGTADDPAKEEQLRAVWGDYRKVARIADDRNLILYDRTVPGALETMVEALKVKTS